MNDCDLRVEGWSGYNTRLNGIYSPIEGKMANGRPVFKHMHEDGVGAGKDWCRMYWANGFWMIGDKDAQSGVCVAAAQSLSENPTGIAPNAQWFEINGACEGSDSSGDPADFSPFYGHIKVVGKESPDPMTKPPVLDMFRFACDLHWQVLRMSRFEYTVFISQLAALSILRCVYSVSLYYYPFAMSIVMDAAVNDWDRLAVSLRHIAVFTTGMIVLKAGMKYCWVKLLISVNQATAYFIHGSLYGNQEISMLNTVDQRVTDDLEAFLVGFWGELGLVSVLLESFSTFIAGTLISWQRLGVLACVVAFVYSSLTTVVDVMLSWPLQRLVTDMSRAKGKLRASVVLKLNASPDITLQQILSNVDGSVEAFSNMYFTAHYYIGLSLDIQASIERYILPVLLALLPFCLYGGQPSVQQYAQDVGTITMLTASLTAFNHIPATLSSLEAVRTRVQEVTVNLVSPASMDTALL